MLTAGEMAKRQQVLAEFGEFTLRSDDLDAVLTQACKLVADALGTTRAKILEIERESDCLCVRAGVGWDPGIVGSLRLPMSEHSSETYSINAGRPVITNDLQTEDRFDVPEFLKQAGVRALVNVPVFLPGGQPFGLLQVDATEPRAFDDEDVQFLRTYSMLLGPVIDRLIKVKQLTASEARLASVLAQVPIGVGLFDTQGRFLLRNPRLMELVGEFLPSRDASLGHFGKGFDPAGLPVPPGDYPGARALRGEQATIPTDFRREEGGQERWLRVTAVPLRDGSAVQGGITVVQDVTRERQAQERISVLAHRNAEILESISDAFYAIDSDWRFTYVNRKAEEWWGRSRSSLIGQSYREVFARAAGSAPFLAHEQASRTREVVRLEAISPILGHWIDISIYPTADGGLSVYFRDISDRKEAEERLRDREERLRLVVEGARDYAIFTTDPAGRIVDWHAGASTVFGFSAEEIRGKDAAILYTPEDRAAGVPEKELEDARAAGSAPNVRWHMRKDGGLVFIEGHVVPLRDGAGAIIGYLKIGRDATDRRRADEKLRESERRFRTLAEGIPQLVWRAAGHGRWSWASPQWSAFTGQGDPESHGWGWLDCLHPDDRETARRAWETAELHGAFHADFRIRNASTGEFRYFQTRATPVRDERGEIVEWLGTSTDVEELLRLQEEQGVLVAELQHRTRNLIGVVQSLADRTLAGSASLGEFRRQFRERLEALARVQGLLSRKDKGQRVTFDELIRTELAGLGALDKAGQGPQVSLSGPDGVRLRSATVQTLALGLHELATNAVKYGALSRPEGRLNVSWEVVGPETGERRLRVSWSEAGVRPRTRDLAGAAAHRGYGRELIERALPYQLRAETAYEITGEGVRCTISLPLLDE